MVRLFAGVCLAAALAGLSGCGAGAVSATGTSAAGAVRATGMVHGGQQPVTGATIQLWAVGTTGFGSGATPLISSTVTTSDGTGTADSNANQGNANNTLAAGSFTLNFSGAYSCPSSSTLVYMTATGGNPGLGGTVNNTAIVMLAMLGQCGTLNSSTYIVVNELTTAGAAFILSPFMSAGGSIGSPSDSASVQALQNAVNALAGIVSYATGSAPSGYPKLETLADATVQCVNSTGPTSSNCSALFSDTTPSGGTAPTTVLAALLNIALNPTLNGTAIYNLSTANAPFQPTLTSAPALWNITTTNGAKSACGTSGGGDEVTGTIAYSGTATGRIYIAINNTGGCDIGTEGTSITSPGTYTIHGVPPGTYTLTAFMDVQKSSAEPQGFGNGNAADPTGSTASFGVGSANVTAPTLTLADPGTVTVTTAPTLVSVGPFSGGAVLQYKPVTNSNQVESATSYTLQWSTNSGFSPLAGSQTFAASGSDTNVWFVNGLTNATAYYFRAYATSGGTAQGPYSSIFGPVTIGASTSGSAVSGAVSFTGAATGPLYVGVYDQDSNTIAPFLESFASPASAQAYTVDVTDDSSAVYIPVAVIDQNNDGIVDAGDITNVNFQGSPIAVTGALTNQNLTLPSGSGQAYVTTQHYYEAGVSASYGLYFLVNFGGKLPVGVTLLNSYNPDGANIDNGPLDIASCAVPPNSCNEGQSGFQLFFNLGTNSPTAGDTYLMNVTYSDGTSGVLTATVSNVLNTPPTNLAPTSGGSTSTTPTFTWTDPVCGACGTYTYTLYLSGPSGGIWYVPGTGNGLPPGTSSVTWGVDPTNSGNTPSVGSLTLGTSYTWSVTVQDGSYNWATDTVTYQP